MKISDLKMCFSDNPRAKRVISYFWDDPFYKGKLCEYHGEKTPDAIYVFLRNEYLELLEIDDLKKQYREEYKKLIKKLSDALYNDRYYWVIGTKWETIILERNQKQNEQRNERREKREKLEFLYTRLELKKMKRDIIGHIARMDPLFNEVILRENSDYPISSREDLYDCFEKIILVPILQGEKSFSKLTFYLMNKISKIAYNNKRYWAIKNTLDYDKIENEIEIKK